MIVSHKHKFIFVHIPKSAGSSITEALIPYLDKKRSGKAIGDRGWQIEYHSAGGMHSGLNDKRLKKLESVRNGYCVFSVVRNPWDRATSYYRCGWMGKNPSFVDACKSGTTGWHRFTDPQVNWLCGNDSSPDFLIRFERLSEDWLTLCEKLGIEHVQLPENLMRDNSTRGNSWKKYYENDEDAISTIGKIYKKDIERFGYKYEG